MRLNMATALVAGFGVVLISVFSQPPPSLSEQNSSDSSTPNPNAMHIRKEIEKIESALPQIRDRAAGLYLLARRYSQLQDFQKAVSLLRECVSFDEGFDPEAASEFQPLHSDNQFRTLAERVRRRHPPVHRAHIAFSVSQSDLFPEGLAVDSSRGRFYLGSLRYRKIIHITETGESSDLGSSDSYSLMPVVGIRVDTVDHSLWAATGADDDSASELVHFDGRGKLLDRFSAPGPAPHGFNDVVVRHGQDVYVTDTAANEVYRFDQKSRSFTPLVFPRPLFYPNGIALSDEGNLLYVADIFGVMFMDLQDNKVSEVDPGERNTLAGIDGMYWYKGSLLGIQYGTSSYRVMRWRLSPAGLRVASAEVLESRTPLLSFPTTGAIYQGEFYFIANTGIANLKDSQIVDPKKLEPIHIAVVHLK